MSGPVQVLVPQKMLKQVKSCTDKLPAPVEVSAYRRLDKKKLDMLSKGKLLIFAEIEKFKKAFAGVATDSVSTIVPGKMLLLCNPGDLEQHSIPHLYGVDLIDEEPNDFLVTFKISKALAEMQYDDEIQSVRQEGSKAAVDLESLNEIGMALSTEKDLQSLLDLIVSKSRQMTWADAGSLYLIEKDQEREEKREDYFHDKKMRFQVSQNDSVRVPFQSLVLNISKSSIYGYVAITQDPLNLDDVYHIPEDQEFGWGGKDFDAGIGYRSMSMLTVPMVNYRGETIGVIQLLNRKMDPNIKLSDPAKAEDYIRPFSEHDMRMAMSIASQASIAIQNTQLVDSIRTLFDGFINASVEAIESRDPTTSGHSRRVATLTVSLAELVDGSTEKSFKDILFTREQLQEIRYASLLHDFGKIGVREHVLIKAKKLYPHELQTLEDRFELIRTLTTLNSTFKKLNVIESSSEQSQRDVLAQTEATFDMELKEVEELLAFIRSCNEPTVLAQGGFEQLHEIAKKIFKKLDGKKEAYLTGEELVSLSVPRGSLTEQDRKEIESHVTHTYKFLTTIPWTSDLRNVPEIAYAHHEKLDGSGYPNRLTTDQIPIQSKMMTISDIFDALTASDRPYKKALPAERALNILQEEAKAGHIDTDLLEMFITSGKYQEVLVTG